MTKSQKIILSILTASACILSLAVIYTGTQAYLSWIQQPLGPALEYSTEWALPATWTVLPGTHQAVLTPASALNYETETPSRLFQPCTNLATLIILVIGNDSRSDDYRYGRADVIRSTRGFQGTAHYRGGIST